MKTIWHAYINTSLILKITIALILGIIVGLIFGQQAADILDPFGQLLLNLLKFLIIPIVLFTLMVGINQTDLTRLGRMGGKLLGYYVISTAIAIIIGITIASLLDPGTGMTLSGDENVKVPENPGVISVLLSIVPQNIVSAFSNLNLLGIIFTALIFGIAISFMRSNDNLHALGEHVYKLIDGLNEATMKIMKGILQYLPIGIFAIIAKTVGEQGTDTILSLGRMVAVLYIALLVHLGLYIVMMLLFKIHPGSFFRHAGKPMMTAFATQSSSGTLPLTLEAAQNLGLSKSLYGFSLPLGATINMDGAAIRIAISAVFAANVVGEPLSLTQMIIIVLIGTLASIGTAGVPGAGIIMIATVFAQVGLPIETVALLTSIDALVGMGCTALNVTGDLVGTSLISQTEKNKKTS